MIAPARANAKERSAEPVSAMEHFYRMRNAYEAGEVSRHVRQRTGLAISGASADHKYRNESQFLRAIEVARDIDVNDAVVGQGVNRVVANVCQDGFKLDPSTGNKILDRMLRERWEDWTSDPQECDSQGESDFDEMAELAFRHAIVDGDIFGNPLEAGPLEMIEAHRCRSSNWSKNGDMVHGVKLSPDRRRVTFHITKDDIDPHRPVTLADLTPFPAYDENGDRSFFQLYLPRRKTQTRGITCLAPIVTPASQRDDIDFAKLVQQQITSCFAILREKHFELPKPGQKGARDALGNQSELTDADGWRRLMEKISPGMDVIGKPGEKLTGFSPNIPGENYIDHIRLVLTYIAINLDLPLIVLLLDASMTNFSGWRGAWDQAKIRLRKLQRARVKRWDKPIYCWKVRQWLQENDELGRRLQRAMDSANVRIFRHKWKLPSWPYIEPVKDVTADILERRNLGNSPRRIQANRGREWEEVVSELVEDNVLAIETAMAAHAKLSAKYPDNQLDWKEVLSLPTPDHVSAQWDTSKPDSAGSEQPEQEEPETP